MEKCAQAGDIIVYGGSAQPGNWVPWLIPEWDELLVSILQLAASLLRARWCALFAFDQGQEGLLLARLWDDTSGVIPGTRLVPPDGLEMRVASGGEGLAALRVGQEVLGSARGDHLAVYPCACAPIQIDGRRLGAVEVVRPPEGAPFRPEDVRALELVARQLALSLRNSALHGELTQLANTDGLTGAYNFRYFQDQLEAEVDRANRYGRTLSLLMLDLNHFKSYNDRFGHQMGDVALHRIATVIQRTVRRIDMVARYGGDEFAVILPETNAFQAFASASRIARAVWEKGLPELPRAGLESISLSVGISSFPSPAGSKNDLIGQADEALYRAKRSRVRTIRVWDPSWRGKPEDTLGGDRPPTTWQRGGSGTSGPGSRATGRR